jgi:signal transduction histidine kinase
MRISIRYQIVALLGAILMGALGSYLYLATRLFSSDKLAYLYDFNSQLVGTVAEQVQAHLESRIDRLRYFGAERGDENRAAQTLIAADETLLGIEVWERGPGGLRRVFEQTDRARLAAANLALEDLAEARRSYPVPLEEVEAEQSLLWNASLPPDLAVLRLATVTAALDRIVVADFSPDQLLRIFSRSKLAQVYLVDARGRVLAHPDAAEVISHTSHATDALVRTALEAHAARGVKELERSTGAVIGAFAAVPVSRLFVIVEIPKARALEAARELSRQSVLFGVLVMAISLLASIYFSRRVTAPLRRLEEKMAVISQGEFGVEVPVTSRNEIGRLASAFNRMSQELSRRDALLMEAHEQLVQSEKLSALGEMSAGLAHEVKNPMVGIVGFAELGQEVETLAEAHEYFELIRSDAHRANEILQSLLEFARPQKVEMTPLDPNEVVRGAVRLVAHSLLIQGVRLQADYKDGLPNVTGNANQLRQVLVNLMMNATHAMERSAEKVLTVVTSLAGELVDIQVRDTGEGMTEEVRQKIFRPFFTTKPRGKGTGLGLSVSRSIIAQHSGDLSVQSEPGKGTAFSIRLPVATANPAQEQPLAVG